MSDPLNYSAVTPRFGFPLLFSGQSQKEVTVNEALTLIDVLLCGSVEGVVTTEPGNPVPGQAWIVGSNPTGLFAGHADNLAAWTEGGWRMLVPQDGMMVMDRSIDARRHYSTGWSTVSSPNLPSGGTTVDMEARNCLTELVNALEAGRIISAN